MRHHPGLGPGLPGGRRGGRRRFAGTGTGITTAVGEQPEVTITPYADGPLIVRGAFEIVAPDGTRIDPGRDVVALCRCGRSMLKPFCDGSHVGRFRVPAGDARPAHLRPTPAPPPPEGLVPDAERDPATAARSA